MALRQGEVTQPVVPAQDLCGGQIVLGGVGDTLQVACGTADLRFEDVGGVAGIEGEVTVEGGECRIAVRHGRYPPRRNSITVGADLHAQAGRDCTRNMRVAP